MSVVFNYTPSVERVPLTSFELNAGTPPIPAFRARC